MSAIDRLQSLIDHWDTVAGHAGHSSFSVRVQGSHPQESTNEAAYSDCGHDGHAGHAKNDESCAETELEAAKKLADFEERAAILEYDGGLEREQAESEAAHIVYCRTCQHWTPDTENPSMGLGECSQRPTGRLPLPWPGTSCWKWEGP